MEIYKFYETLNARFQDVKKLYQNMGWGEPVLTPGAPIALRAFWTIFVPESDEE